MLSINHRDRSQMASAAFQSKVFNRRLAMVMLGFVFAASVVMMSSSRSAQTAGDYAHNSTLAIPACVVTNLNTSATFTTIQAAINAAAAGHVIEASPCTYNENVLIDKNDLTLRSSGGRAVTTIQGSFPSPNNATVGVGNLISGVKIGQAGKGFTIIGFDGDGGVEAAAVYLTGAHNNITIEGNELRANGEYSLLSNFDAAIDGIVVNNNLFTGKTFVGTTPGGCGFSTQFDPGNNVPRQLVSMSGGAGVTNSKNVTFTNNTVTGIAGGPTMATGCTTSGQGNTLVTIDVIGATIRQNTFNGTTTRFASSLRTRGHATSISCNTFRSVNLGTDLGSFATHIFFGSANPFDGTASPNTLAGVASANAFPDGGAYLTPNNANSYSIYKDVAQATVAATSIGAGQTAVSASAILTPPTIVCPGSLTKFTDSGQFTATVNPGTPVVTDSLGVSSVTGVRNDGKALNAPYPIGVTLITWTAINACGSASTCTQSIAVMAPSGTRRRP